MSIATVKPGTVTLMAVNIGIKSAPSPPMVMTPAPFVTLTNWSCRHPARLTFFAVSVVVARTSPKAKSPARRLCRWSTPSRSETTYGPDGHVDVDRLAADGEGVR